MWLVSFNPRQQRLALYKNLFLNRKLGSAKTNNKMRQEHFVRTSFASSLSEPWQKNKSFVTMSSSS